MPNFIYFVPCFWQKTVHGQDGRRLACLGEPRVLGSSPFLANEGLVPFLATGLTVFVLLHLMAAGASREALFGPREKFFYSSLVKFILQFYFWLLYTMYWLFDLFLLKPLGNMRRKANLHIGILTTNQICIQCVIDLFFYIFICILSLLFFALWMEFKW